jgi:hypothetical protein
MCGIRTARDSLLVALLAGISGTVALPTSASGRTPAQAPAAARSEPETEEPASEARFRRLSLAIGMNLQFGNGWMASVDGSMGPLAEYAGLGVTTAHEEDNTSVPDLVLGYCITETLQIRLSRAVNEMGAARYYSRDWDPGRCDTCPRRGASYIFTGEAISYGIAVGFLVPAAGLRGGAGLTWNESHLNFNGQSEGSQGSEVSESSVKGSGLGFLLEAGVTLPRNSLFFLDMGITYRFVGSETFSPETIVVDSGNGGVAREFPPTRVSLNSLALVLAFGLRP